MSKQFRILLRSTDNRIESVTLDQTPSVTLSDLRLLLPFCSSSYYFVHDGKALSDSTFLASLKLSPFSILTMFPRILGGGGDGGATGAESRDCYLNMYAEKKPDKVDPNEKRLSKWLNCALSHEPLAAPCVIDHLGNIFNKEALVEALITRRLPDQFRHIKGLKDMTNIYLESVKGESANSSIRFQCPITSIEFNGRYKFFALLKCGHVLSAKALKEVKSSACLVCYKEFEEADKIVINGSDEEVAELRARMEEERSKIKEKRGSKKGKIGDVAVLGLRNDPEMGKTVPLSGRKHQTEEPNPLEEIRGKVPLHGRLEVARKKNTGPSIKRFKAVDAAPAHADKEVYASIFTSSRKSDFKETFTCRSLPLGRN